MAISDSARFFSLHVPLSLAHDVAPTLLKMLLKPKYSELQSSEVVEMEDSSSNEHVGAATDDLLTPPDSHKIPSRDAPLRWLGLVAFLLVTCAAIITLIVLMIVKSI